MRISGSNGIPSGGYPDAFVEEDRQELPSSEEYILVYMISPLHLLRILRRNRALGFDTRVLRVNSDIFKIDVRKDWPSPFMIAKCIRSLTYPIRIIVLALVTIFERRRQDRAEDVRQSYGKNARDEALDEYRRLLEITFSDERPINYVMNFVRDWANCV